MKNYQKPSRNLIIILSLFLLLGISCKKDGKSKSDIIGKVDPKIEKLKLQPGFHAEHLYDIAENGKGSWVAMTFDGKGRLITSDQYGALYRLELPAIGSDSLRPSIEKLIVGNGTDVDSAKSHIGMGSAQGLLWAFNSLYVMVNVDDRNEDFEKKSGLYRLQDTNGDDQFDKVTLLKSINGSGEHGPHSIVLSPDKKSLYIVAGNHTDLPQMDDYRLPPVWQIDNLFPQIKDPRGHANDKTVPGGWIAKTDPNGERWELISAGYRNTYDIAFNEAGDLFAYDSDMEWDFGMPWYRPTRLVHVTSGSEFGWRTGNGKLPAEYPDNLPPILNIGQGSPTNLVSGINTNFPEKYRHSMFGFDWSFGIIYSFHIKPEGSSYSATGEEFLSGSPLPLTDGVVGSDGALYFLTGGRRLQSDLYRVYYDDLNDKNEVLDSNVSSFTETEAHKIREQLEQYHEGSKAGAVDFAWPFLGDTDRFVSYAARIAIEHQPVSQWQERALREENPQILTSAIIALSRQGKSNLKNEMLKSLMRIDYKNLSEKDQINELRAIELVLYRDGKPTANVKKDLIAYLTPHYPAITNNLNRILSKILIHLEVPQAVKITLTLLENAKDDNSEQKSVLGSSDLILRNPQYGLDIAKMLAKTPPAQQIYLAIVLSEAEIGWTPELYEEYFKWFNNAFNYKGGLSYVGYIDTARKKALSHVPEKRFDYYNTLSGASLVSGSGIDLAGIPAPEGPGRNWTMEEALPLVNSLDNQDLNRGKSLFAATLCISCHTMKGEGTAIGPDLTQLGNRFTPKDILESIIQPNKVISDQYASTVFYLEDDSSVVGKLIKEDESTYYVSQNPFSPLDLREIPKINVTNTKISDVSMMLPGLINSLNPEELQDLIAYFISGGNEEHEVYKAKSE